MGIILIGVLFLLLTIFCASKDKDGWAGFCLVVAACGILYGGLFSLTMPDVEGFEHKYYHLREELDIYHATDTTATYNYLSDLDKEMSNINDQIARNKKHAGSFWVGSFHSEKIGQFEPFNIKEELK